MENVEYVKKRTDGGRSLFLSLVRDCSGVLVWSENVSGMMSINWTRVHARARVFVHVDGLKVGEIGSSLLWF